MSRSNVGSPLPHRGEAWRHRSSSRRHSPAHRRARGAGAAPAASPSRRTSLRDREAPAPLPEPLSAVPTSPASCRSSAGRSSCWEARTCCARFTESGRLPGRGGVVLGLAYAVAWFGAADRAGVTRPLSGLFHGLAAVVISLPLLWEASAHFRLLSPPASAAMLIADHRSRARRRLASTSAEPGWCRRHRIDRRDRGTRGGDRAPAAVCCWSAGARRVHVVAERRARLVVAALASGVRGRPRGPRAGRREPASSRRRSRTEP